MDDGRKRLAAMERRVRAALRRGEEVSYPTRNSVGPVRVILGPKASDTHVSKAVAHFMQHGGGPQ